MSVSTSTSPTTRLDRTDAIPLSAQLYKIFQENMRNGVWTPNSMIPSENKLCEIFGVSRMTVRGVITQFVSQGLLYRIPGKGTFVSDKKIEISGLQYAGIRAQLEQQGHSVSTILKSCKRLPADEYLAHKLGLQYGEEIYEIRRTRIANGVTISYHQSFVPVIFCPELEKKDLQNEQLCKVMSTDYQLQRGRVQETLESFTAGMAEAHYLGVCVGAPLILLQDQLYTPDERIYEYSRVYFRGDKIKIRLEY